MDSRVIRALLFIMAVVIFGFAVAMLMRPARAHDHEHPENNQWMRELGAGRGPCCDGSDALKIEDPNWIITSDGKDPDGKPCVNNLANGEASSSKEGHYCVRLRIYPDKGVQSPMEWFLVTDDTIVHSTKADGIVRVWPITSSMNGEQNRVYGIRCFLEGSGA